jgi:hypothetical protein
MANNFEESQGSQRAVVPVMMTMMMSLFISQILAPLSCLHVYPMKLSLL